MKAIIVVDSSGADIAFYSLDKPFEQYIIKRFSTLGFTDPNDAEESSRFDMRSALTAFFVPFSTSIDVMTSMKMPLYSIGCDNDLILIFKKFDSNVYIGIGQNGEECEQLITRRVVVFHSIVSMLYGIAVDRMNPEDPDQKAVEWELLNRTLREYDRLYKNAPSFLLEALEYFHFDCPAEVHPLYVICQRLVKDACNPQNNGGIKRIVYSTILVDSKLVIAPKSSRMKPPDVLLTILVVSALFSDKMPVPPPSCGVYSERRSSSESRLQKEGDELMQVETPYVTPHGTPGPGTPPPAYADIYAQDDGHDEPEPFPAVKRVMDIFHGNKTAPVFEASQSKCPPGESAAPDAKFIEHMIFIQGKPHMLSCLELYKGIILVLISELPNKEFSTVVADAVQEMSVIFSGCTQKGQCLRIFDSLDTTMKKIIGFGKAEAQVKNSEKLKGLTAQVQRSWDGLKNSNFRNYLERLQEGLVNPSDSEALKIDTQGRSLIDRLIKLFGGVYFSPMQAEYDCTIATEKLLRLCNEFSRDYAAFVVVKAQLSFPVANFSELYQGLVHFIFIDRSYGDMKMPSIYDEGPLCTIPYVDNLAKRGLGCTPGTYLKRKMWKMVEHVQTLLEQGYVVQCWKDVEFLYTYHAWVNIPYADIAGPLRYHQPKVHCEVFNIPGIIGTPFYSSLSHAPRNRDVRKGLTVAEGSDCFLYELYCIHEATVPVGQAIRHSRMLIKTLWDTTQEAQIPFH